MVATHCRLLYTGALFWYCNFWPPLVPNPCFRPLWEPCHDGALKLKPKKTTTSKIVYCQKNCGENKPIITITSRQKGGAFCFHESKFLVTTKQNPQIFVLGVKYICLQIQVYILWRPFLWSLLAPSPQPPPKPMSVTSSRSPVVNLPPSSCLLWAKYFTKFWKYFWALEFFQFWLFANLQCPFHT